MRRALRTGFTALALALAGVALGAGSLQAQQAPAAPPPSGDVPPGPAAIRGRVVHAENPAAAAHVDVVLYALPPSGVPGVRRATTDANGAFAFEGIGNDPETAYLVGARYGEVPFPGERVTFAPGEIERTLEVKIADATDDPRGVEAREGTITLERTASGLRVTEAWRLANPGSRVVNVAAAARERGRPAFATTLPAGAGALSHPLGMKPDGVVQRGDELLFFGPVYPGEQELTYSYELPHGAGDVVLSKALTTGARVLRVRAPESLGTIDAPGFAAVDDEAARGAGLRVLESKDLAPGRRVALTFSLAALRSDPDLLSVDEVAMQVELDAGAMLFAHQRWSLRVAGDAPLAGTPEAPLLWIPLPTDSDDLRFAPAAQQLGLVPDARGGLAILGPLPPGESSVEFVYRRTIEEGTVDVDLTFEKATPLLSVYVSDTGIVPESERLHRRRPVRSQDGAFLLHLEAFEIEAGETVALRLKPLPSGGTTTPMLVVLGVAGAAALAAWFLFAPLGGRAREEARDEEELPLLRRERESLYTAMRDLDDDRETGKIDELDWRTMRDDLRARALALLETERAEAAASAEEAASAGAAPAPGASVTRAGPTSGTTPGAAFCTACGAAARPEDRFCSHCGARLAAPAGPADREAASA